MFLSNYISEGDKMIKKLIYLTNIILIGLIVFLLFQKNDVKVVPVKVEIKGAVKNVGVYEINPNDRVSDLITLSGGLKEDADTSTINLSKELKNEDVVIVYTKEEINEMKKGSTSIKYIEKQCVCPKIENAACIEDIIDNSNSIINKTGKISLNTATLDELLTIPGIGQSKAKLIIEYRNTNGFKKIEDIMNVKGIGNGIFEKIKDYITI